MRCLWDGAMILKIFYNVLDIEGHFTFRKEESPVPANVLQLWRDRGYNPSATGVAYVRFDGNGKEYIYPAYFWSE